MESIINLQPKDKETLAAKAMSLAWKVYNGQYKFIGKSFAQALKDAWAKIRLMKALKQPMCCFEFRKKSLKKGETATLGTDSLAGTLSSSGTSPNRHGGRLTAVH